MVEMEKQWPARTKKAFVEEQLYVNRDKLVASIAADLDDIDEKIKVLAQRRACDGIRLGELRAEKQRLELHRASLLRHWKGE